MVLIDERRDHLGRRSEATAHVGLQTTQALGGQHALTVGGIGGLALLYRQGVERDDVPSVVIGPLAHPVGEGFNECFKIGQGGQR